MGLFDFFKTPEKQEPAPDQGTGTELIANYVNMKQFRGTKRLHVTVYGDIENANENALQLLGDEDELYCVGRDITLTSFRYDGGTGIKVAVDGKHVGVAWDPRTEDERSQIYSAAYSGSIDGVYVKIEKQSQDRAKVSLFIKMRT